jgi:hypothetical protein
MLAPACVGMAPSHVPIRWPGTDLWPAGGFGRRSGVLLVLLHPRGGRRFGVHPNRLQRVVVIKIGTPSDESGEAKGPFRVSSMSHPTPMQEYRSARGWLPRDV